MAADGDREWAVWSDGKAKIKESTANSRKRKNTGAHVFETDSVNGPPVYSDDLSVEDRTVQKMRNQKSPVDQYHTVHLVLSF